VLAGTLLCACACAVLVAAELARAHALRLVAKPLASLGFVIVATVALDRTLPELAGLAAWIWIGQLAGAAGDIALLVSSSYRRRNDPRHRTWFAYGLAAFLIGHLAYLVGFARVVSPVDWPQAAGWLAIAPVAVALWVARWLAPRLGSLRVPVIVYVAVITAMLIAAIAVWRAAPVPLANRQLLAVGALLFFLSDLAVARDTFVAASRANRAWGLPAYYTGQLLLAWCTT
jgi:uncharacterized membrane protein YhhN